MMSIAAGEFKTHCLKLMSLAHDKHETIIITKRGRPIAKLVPYEDDKPFSLYGCMAGAVDSSDDIVEFNTAADWNMYDEETSYLY